MIGSFNMSTELAIGLFIVGNVSAYIFYYFVLSGAPSTHAGSEFINYQGDDKP